ncbi:rhomboid family intramembrane serine protease [Fusibacter ferrireducens]|uniref:Rhomboid family intramembrane serine protease n=1 Tax=Fusibacter ferrireducens TaxID=2785058 RepID=A0ABR9ZQY3_9FIRM|nr:rhomboid family intramembrane serine protease [Fusibacter ferrireducens]MBF4692852.1 rhomboid family intramembrane serine protease [Fusibacter ferrireducens]
MANLNYYIRKIKTATLTEILIGINIIMFLLTTLIDIAGGEAWLILGAKINILIAMGQVWRLLTATFLHAGIMHLIFNMMALYILGRDIERFYGPKKYLFIYFMSGLVGSAFSFLLVPNTSVGASGAIFGLFGANLYLYFVNPHAYKRIFGTDFLILIGINLVISFVRPNIDVVGHIAGLITGFIAAFGVGIYHENAFTPKRILIQAFTIALFILPTVAGFTIMRSTPDFYLNSASYYYYQDKPEKAKEVIEQGLEKFPNALQLKQILVELNK